MYDGKNHALFVKYAIPQMIGLLFNSIYTADDWPAVQFYLYRR